MTVSPLDQANRPYSNGAAQALIDGQAKVSIAPANTQGFSLTGNGLRGAPSMLSTHAPTGAHRTFVSQQTASGDASPFDPVDQDTLAAGWGSTFTSLAPNLRPELEVALKIAARWKLSSDETAIVLGYDVGLQLAPLMSGLFGFGTRDRQDRARLLYDIYEGLFSLFRSPAKERKFLHTKQPKLAGQTLHDLMIEGSMLRLIMARDFVNFYNGRS